MIIRITFSENADSDLLEKNMPFFAEHGNMLHFLTPVSNESESDFNQIKEIFSSGKRVFRFSIRSDNADLIYSHLKQAIYDYFICILKNANLMKSRLDLDNIKIKMVDSIPDTDNSKGTVFYWHQSSDTLITF